MIEPILVFLIWLILPAFLILIFTWISRIGIYHRLKSTNAPDGEPFHTKFRLVFEFNFYLSLVIAAAVYITTTNSLTTTNPLQKSPDPWDIAELTFIVSLAILLIQRILANPPSIVVNFLHRRCPDIQRDKLITRYKDFVLSFFYSFICAAIVVVLLLASYNIMINKELGLSTQHLTYRDFIIATVIYILSLVIITFLGEGLLYLAQPESRENDP
jgi:hypothetical protein